MVPDLTKNQIVVWVPPSTLEIGDLLRSGTFSQLSGTSQVTGGPRSQQVPEFKSSTCTGCSSSCISSQIFIGRGPSTTTASIVHPLCVLPYRMRIIKRTFAICSIGSATVPDTSTTKDTSTVARSSHKHQCPSCHIRSIPIPYK